MNRSPGRSPRGCIGTLCGRAGRLADGPIHQLLLGRDPSDGGRLASQPTISRFEHAAAPHLRQILLPRLRWTYDRMTMRVTIPPRSSDTSAEADHVQIELIRAAPVSRRLGMAWSLSATVIGAARRALARAQPLASAEERDLRFVEIQYGSNLAEALRADLARRRAHDPERG